MKYEPPFEITRLILNHVASISELIGRCVALQEAILTPKLRRSNRIRTVQASLAIENNSLSLDQVTAVFEGKRVLGLPREIQEVRNAFKSYDKLGIWNPVRLDDFLDAHATMTDKLLDNPGRLRAGGVGIYRGETLVHMAPPAKLVKSLIQNLLEWLDQTEVHPIVSSCVVHYELEFIHPFDDGNGRLGRLWQTLILSQWQPLLAYLPVETLIRERQDEYYQVLADSDAAGTATAFVEFMAGVIDRALLEFAQSSEKSSVMSSEKSSVIILELLRNNPVLTIKELAVQLGMTSRGIEKQLATLRKEGKLDRTGSARSGSWRVID